MQKNMPAVSSDISCKQKVYLYFHKTDKLGPFFGVAAPLWFQSSGGIIAWYLQNSCGEGVYAAFSSCRWYPKCKIAMDRTIKEVQVEGGEEVGDKHLAVVILFKNPQFPHDSGVTLADVFIYLRHLYCVTGTQT